MICDKKNLIVFLRVNHVLFILRPKRLIISEALPYNSYTQRKLRLKYLLHMIAFQTWFTLDTALKLLSFLSRDKSFKQACLSIYENLKFLKLFETVVIVFWNLLDFHEFLCYFFYLCLSFGVLHEKAENSFCFTFRNLFDKQLTNNYKIYFIFFFQGTKACLRQKVFGRATTSILREQKRVF